MLVVGAGIGGLAAAIDCAAAGLPVTVLERTSAPGGKMSETIVCGEAIDAGPTVLTLRPVFERLFADAGADLAAEVPMTRADVLARHYWSDGGPLDLFADVEASADAIGAFAGAEDARGYRSFSAAARTIHRALRTTFMEAPKPHTPIDLMWRSGLGGLLGFTKLDPYRSLAKMAAGHFSDPRLVQLFGRYATYCGSSPYQTPATLALVADVEREAVWLVEGGMHRLAEGMAALAERMGVRFRYEAEVRELAVESGRTVGADLASGERIDGASIILNTDAAALAAGCFGKEAARGRAEFRRDERSYSALTVAAIADLGGVPIGRHTVFFSDDGPAEFAELDAGGMPADPTVYACAQDRDDAGVRSRDGPERLFLVLNAPADGDTHTYDEAEIDRCTTAALTRLSRSGLQISPRGLSISTPSDFARRFPATGGALYGRASHGWTASFRRPGATTAIRGLYCAGGSVHPGAGVPMAALSGRLAAQALLRDRASTSISPRAAMPGGMSMRSATTAATR